MKKIFILTGPTGCGKTYSAFKHLNKKDKAIYIAPCRQLVYEAFKKYHKKGDSLLCSDIHINGKGYKTFATYESIKKDIIKDIDVLIIDEAHFLADKERGPHLRSLVSYCEKYNKKVLLLTATLNFSYKKAKIINLKTKINFKKKEVDFNNFLERMKQGIPTLIFHSKKSTCGMYARMYNLKGGIITADTPVIDRIKIINLFEEGKISLIEATNAMAQGVNISCENLYINNNRFDDESTIIQKYGRLGRMNLVSSNKSLTYCYGAETSLNIKMLKTKIESNKEKLSIKKHMAIRPYEEIVKQELSQKDTKKLYKLLNV